MAAGIDAAYAPTWLPEGFIPVQSDIYVSEENGWCAAHLFATNVEEERNLSLSFDLRTDPGGVGSTVYPKDDTPIVTIERGGVTFYIISNGAWRSLAWMDGGISGSVGGNLTEEYTNLPTLIGLYAALRAFGGEEKRERLFFPAALMGACFAFAFLTRANNALPLSAVTAVLSLGLLVSRRFASLLRCAAGFLLGLAAVTLPVVLWLAARGALFDAFYGAIIHNFLYAEAGGGSRMQMLLHAGYGRVAMVMAALACMGALVLYRKRRALWFSLAMVAGAAAGGLAAFISHKFYDHYLMIGAPVAALGAAALLMAFEGRTRRAALGIAALVCCAWLCVKGQETNAWRLSEREGWDAFAANAQALMAKVPEQERDRFMAYRVEPKWYVAAEALPCMRFYFLQEILGQVNPAVMDEIAKTFESDPPLWLVIYYNRAYDPPYDPRVEAIFETRYAFVDAAGDYQLLRLIEP